MTKRGKLTKLSAIVMALIMALTMMSMLLAACGGKATVSLDKTELAIYVGDSVKLTATVTGDDDAEVEWETSDSKVATVKRGTVTAVAVGSATITAKLENGESATCSVSVSERTVTIDKTSAEINLDESATLQLTATASDGGEITWSSSNPAVATVNSSGLVTGIDVGKATITAQRGTAKATCEVEVIEPSRPEDYYKITKLTNSEVVADPGVWHYHADGSQGGDYNFEGDLIHKNSTATATLTVIPNPANSQYFYFRYQPNQVEVNEYYTMTLAITITENATLRLGSLGADKKFAGLEETLTANTEKEVEYVGYRNTSEPFSVRINSAIDAAKVTLTVRLVSVVAHDGENLPDYHFHDEEPAINYEEIDKDTSSYDLEAKNNTDTLAAPGKWYYNQGNGSTVSEAKYNNGTITLKYENLTSDSSSNDQLRYRPTDLDGDTKIKVEFTVTGNVDATVVLALNHVTTFVPTGWTSESLTANGTINFSAEFTIGDSQIIFIQVRAAGEDKTNAEFTFSNIKIYKEAEGSTGTPDGNSYTLNPNGNNDGNGGVVRSNPGVWAYMVDGYTEGNTTITEAKMENGVLTWTLTKTEANGYYLRVQPDFAAGTNYKISFDVVINRTGTETVSVSDQNGAGTVKYDTTSGQSIHVEFEGTVADNNLFQFRLRVLDASVEDPITVVLSNIVITAL